MGKIVLTAGSPRRGHPWNASPNITTQPAPGLNQGERYLSHGYAFGITRGY